MKNLVLGIVSLSLLFVTACSDNDEPTLKQTDTAGSTKPKLHNGKEMRGECHFIDSKKDVEKKYSLTFAEDYMLNPIEGRKSFYAQTQAGHEFGCVIFGHERTKGNLKGYHKVDTVEHQISICEGRQDYIYTQFLNADGKPSFRVQCEYKVYEDQLPQAFSPNYDQIKKIRFNGSGKSTVTIREEG